MTQEATKQKRIDKQMTIEEVLSLFPFKAQKLAQEITKAGLHCVGCHAATYETLEAGMLGHGKTVTEIDSLVDSLNKLLDEKVDHSTISLTPRAAQEFRRIRDQEVQKECGLRFGIEMGGCSGFEYILGYSEGKQDDDSTFLSHGVEIHVETAIVPRLLGSEIDFVEGLRDSGFKISNPNVKSSCGCGTSHGY
jgi:iron-sulfur cluster assembly protein